MSDDRDQVMLVVPVATYARRVALMLDVFEDEDGALWRTLDAIADSPHRELVTSYPVVDAGDAQGMAPERLLDSLQEPEGVGLSYRQPHFEVVGQRWRFLKVVDERHTPTTDTPPNRVAAALLRSLLAECRRTTRKLERAHRQGVETADGHAVIEVLEDVREMKRRLTCALDAAPALRDASRLEKVPRNNLVLRHDPRYRRIMHAYIDLLT